MPNLQIQRAVDAAAEELHRQTGWPVIIAVEGSRPDDGYLKFEGAQLSQMESVAENLLRFIYIRTSEASCLCPDCKSALARVELALAALDAQASSSATAH